jgi:WD40 repeat protein/beta-lactamase regulating signal transducer with metallopeptidase domain
MRPWETNAFLPWLGAALFQATLVAALGLLAWLALWRRGPAVRAAALLAGLVGALVVPLLSLVCPVWLPAPGPGPVRRQAEPAAAVVPSARATLPFSSEGPPAVPEPGRAAPDGPAPPQPPVPPQGAPESGLGPAPGPTGTDAPAAVEFPSVPEVLAALWSIGALTWLLRALVRLTALRSWRRRSRPIQDAALAARLAGLARRHGAQTAVEVREGPALRSPLTLGLFRPVILLPAAWRHWTDEQLVLVLDHELAHVRRRDFLAGLLAELAACVYWFHPLVRWAAGRLRLEQEYAADACVLAAGNGPRAYVCCLAQLALEMDGGGPLAPALGRRRPEILKRIDMLRRNTLSQPARLGPRAAVLAGLVAAVAYVACAGVGQPRADAQIRIELQPGAPAAQPKAKDLHGDPLPVGATARLGTVRFRYAATAAAYSPDGKVLALGGADNQVRLLDAAIGKEVRRLRGHQPRTFTPPVDRKSPFDLLVRSVGEGNVTTLAFSPDGKTLATGGWDDMVRLWEVSSGKEVRRIVAHQAMVARVAFSPDGKRLASRGGIDGAVRVWDAATGAELRKFEGLARVNPWRFYREAALAFSPDGKHVVASTRKAIVFFDVDGGKEVASWPGYRDCMYVAYSPDGKLLASGGLDDAAKESYSLRLWDAANGKEVRRCELPKTRKGGTEPPTCFAFSPDGKKLVAAVAEMDAYVFDTDSGKQAQRLSHLWARRVAYAPDGKTVVSLGGPAPRLWDPATGKERFPELAGHRARVAAVAVSPDGKLTASGGEDIRLWETATGKPVRRLAAPAVSLAFSPDGKTLASGGGRALRLWDVQSGKELSNAQEKRLLRAVAFSPDGKVLATGDEQATIRLWEPSTLKMIRQVADVKSLAESLSLAFSPDGKTLACAGAWNQFGMGGITLNLQGRVTVTAKEGYFVLLWNVDSGKEVRRFAGLKDKIKSVAFSPDGRTLAGSSQDGRIVLWEAATGRERLHILAHPVAAAAGYTFGPAQSAVPALAFAPGGKTLVSAGADRTIRLWDASTAKQLGMFSAPGALTSLAITRDGKALITGSADSTVLIWDVRAAEGPQPPRIKVVPIDPKKLQGLKGGITVRQMADGSTQVRAALKKVDAEKGTLALNFGRTFTVPKDAKVVDQDGKEIKDRLKADFFTKPGGMVTVTYRRQDGKEVVSRVRAEVVPAKKDNP